MEMARHPRSGRIYVANERKNCLYVVDPAAGRLETVLDTPAEPHYIDFDERTGRIFVSCGGDGCLLVLDSRHRRLKTVPAGRQPWGVAVDPLRRRLYAVCQGENALWQFHLDSLEAAAGPAPLGKMPRCLAIDPATGRVFVAHRRERRLLVFDPSRPTPIASPATGWDAIGVTMDFRYRRVYVVNRMGELEEEIGQPATVSVIDAERLETVRHVPVGKISHYLALDGPFAYVANEDSLDVSVLDRERMEEVARIGNLGQTVDGIEVHPRNGRLYIPSHLTDEVIVADPAAGKVVARPKVGSWPSGVGIDGSRGRVYVSNMDNGTLTVLRDSDHSTAGEIGLGVGTNKVHRLWSRVAVDERRGRVFVTLTRFNGVAVIDSQSGRVVHRVRLGEENPDEQSAYVRVFEFSLCVDAGSGFAWALNGHRALLAAVDPESGKVAASISLSNLELPLERRFSPFSVLAAHPARRRLYVYNWIVSTETGRVTGSIPRETGTGVTAVDEARDLLYVHGLRGLAVLRADDLRQVDFLPLEPEPGGEPSELRALYALDPLRKRVYAVRHIMLSSNQLEVYEAPA